MNLKELASKINNPEPKLKLIVRLRTAKYISKGHKMVWRKELYPLKSKSDLDMLDVFGEPYEDMNRIINLDECEDNIYEVGITNEKIDWETGYLDDWDYKLIPYKEKS